MNELAGQSLGGYLLEEEIGHGSMGMVYRGKQIALGREVAIKVLPRTLAKDASYVARFIREAQIIAGLNHPNIVQIYDAGQQRGLLYFVMEYVQGPTIGSLLQIDGMMPQYLAAEYGAQIADALDFAYKERNVIHRDIKPENLMLDRWGKIKVMDFGLARAPGHQQITMAKTLVGSLYYSSPEQVWGQTLDNRSDIYALGVVLYEMVTGQRPFTGRTLTELTQAIVGGVLQPPSTINPEVAPDFERIILTAMARNRDNRYTDAGSMAQELRALQLRTPGAIFTPTSLGSGGPPTSGGPFEASPFSPAQPQIRRDGIVVRPPKRPQATRPSYLDLEATHPLPGEVQEQTGEMSPQGSERAPVKLDKQDEYQRPPAISNETVRGSEELPTGPLEPVMHPDAPGKRAEQKDDATNQSEGRRTLWQRIFHKGG
ncbi:MAG TPA: serine/threonine-protein kinase [Ktedonobacteraceae bacterium]|nr:serine/threonine-protein kinase [Ktedonobacteraceae bacterium]